MISSEIGVPESAIIEELSGIALQSVKVQEVITKQNISPESTPYERLTALRSCFSSEIIEKIVEPLNTLSIADVVFSAPSVPEDRLARALTTVEREYSSLSDIDRSKVAEELVTKITEMFLTNARTEYSLQLKKAENAGQEEEISKLSNVLQEIDKRRHEHPRQGG